MLLMVRPRFYEFFTRSLVPLKHYWPINPWRLCDSIKFAVGWGNNNTYKVRPPFILLSGCSLFRLGNHMLDSKERGKIRESIMCCIFRLCKSATHTEKRRSCCYYVQCKHLSKFLFFNMLIGFF